MKNDPIELQIRVPNQTRYLSLVGRISEELAAQIQNYSGDLEALANHINVVLTEAMVNAIRHANEDNPAEVVQIRISVIDDEILIQVFDHGRGFDLSGLVQTKLEPPDGLDEHGRGLYIMRSLMDSVQYFKVDGGNVLEMRKKL